MTAAADQSAYRQFLLNVGHPVPSTVMQRGVHTLIARQVFDPNEIREAMLRCRFTVLGDHTQIAVSACQPAPER